MAAVPPLTINTLKRSVDLCAANQTEFKQCILHQCESLSYPKLHIPVSGPLNYGKSPLLNALLGNTALPICLAPISGNAITYGAELINRIPLADGSSLAVTGPELLQYYGPLNKQRPEVTNMMVQSSHPLLKLGLELVDLPGTDHQLLNHQLADGVIQMLDGRQLMSLDELHELQDWLMEKGVTTVLLMMNFPNLMAPDERQAAMERSHPLATHVSNALPSSLSNPYILNPPVKQLQELLQQQLENVENQPPTHRIELQQKAQQILHTKFQQSVIDLESWLTLENLLEHYQQQFSTELQAGTLSQWIEQTFKPAWIKQKKTVEKWVHKVCELFNQPEPDELTIQWSLLPEIFTQPSHGDAHGYLCSFSAIALLGLKIYIQRVQSMFVPSSEPLQQYRDTKKTLLENVLTDLEQLQLLESFG